MTPPRKGQAPALGKAADAWLATLTRPKTRHDYGWTLRQMRDRFGDDTPLTDLDPREVADWLTGRWGSLSAATQNKNRGAVKAAAAWWAERGWIPDGLTALAKPAKGQEVLPPEVLSPGEVTALMAQCSRDYPTGIRNKALIMLLYRSGLRLGEALAIRPGDIDHEARSMRVLATKSGKAQTRYYHATAEDALNRWLDRRKALGFNGRQTVFCTLTGGELAQAYVRELLGRLGKKAGIEKRIHAHGFRHTFAKELEEQGVPIEVISRLFGHASVAATARYLRSLTNHQAGLALAATSMPGSEGQEPGDGELAMMRELLADPETARMLARMAAERKQGR